MNMPTNPQNKPHISFEKEKQFQNHSKAASGVKGQRLHRKG